MIKKLLSKTATVSFFKSLLGVQKSDQTLLMYEVLRQTYLANHTVLGRFSRLQLAFSLTKYINWSSPLDSDNYIKDHRPAKALSWTRLF